MKLRPFWVNKIEDAWRKKSIVWLSGVRRSGKTTLAKSLANVDYFDCELPRTRQALDDPEGFFKQNLKKRIILDEIHRLGNPSEVLKIAADHFPDIKILATGSSTLGASKKFRDTLTDRKINIWLLPMGEEDLHTFGEQKLLHRLFRGGLPPYFLAEHYPENEFQDWLDSFWAKDIQELFKLEKKYPFQKLFELLHQQSGGIFEASSFAAPCEISRTTVANYLSVLEATLTAYVVRPFNTNKAAEIISAPKVFGFDTGFVVFHKGWESLRREDYGYLWEHYVLNQLLIHTEKRRIYYWRDKQKHEVDFVYKPRTKSPIAIECKWSAKNFIPKNLIAFSKLYPHAKYVVVCNDCEKSFLRKYNNLEIEFTSLSGLIKVCQTN
ncbi:MAG: hypothetical protein A3F16_05380 [Deltaproteobacteria bacterium RIFCSPHIGHO2_12_FULL_43_9]|nr:MAG: hypothetical protein A3F16_05380 [Deltaproteobacteria bacterium RIFCSPHIGHO2_12_FULL_43_9]